MSLKIFSLSAAVTVAATIGAAPAAKAGVITYDPAADFVSGYVSGSNPNGVWSYGYSSTLGGLLHSIALESQEPIPQVNN